MYDFFCDICSFLLILFLHVTILIFVIVHLSVVTFIFVFSFILIGPWLFYLCSIAVVFFEVSHLVVVLICWYDITLYMPTFFQFVPVFTTSLAGTLVLYFYVKVFFIFSWIICFRSYIHFVVFCQELVVDPFYMYI